MIFSLLVKAVLLTFPCGKSPPPFITPRCGKVTSGGSPIILFPAKSGKNESSPELKNLTFHLGENCFSFVASATANHDLQPCCKDLGPW